MIKPAVVTLFTLLSFTHAHAVSALGSTPWPNVCVPGSPWNTTACPADATCCSAGFSSTGMGCCPYKNATCCPGIGGVCCPSGTSCVLARGTSYTSVYNCTTPGGVVVGEDVGVCKPGALLPPSTTKKNVLYIGDSLSIGLTPPLAAALADIALLQHAPADTTDGGAEETAYALQCLDYWLHSPSGQELDPPPDLIVFNSGMHNYRTDPPVPGQEGNATVYPGELAAIADALLGYTKTHPTTRLLFLLTTPQLCNASFDATIASILNPAAVNIMAARGIPVLDPHTPVREHCGGVLPTKGCANEPGWGGDCFCPHCPPGYAWLVNGTLAGPIREMLMG